MHTAQRHLKKLRAEIESNQPAITQLERELLDAETGNIELQNELAALELQRTNLLNSPELAELVSVKAEAAAIREEFSRIEKSIILLTNLASTKGLLA